MLIRVSIVIDVPDSTDELSKLLNRTTVQDTVDAVREAVAGNQPRNRHNRPNHWYGYVRLGWAR